MEEHIKRLEALKKKDELICELTWRDELRRRLREANAFPTKFFPKTLNDD